ncbi:nucleoside-diphosphate kinase [Streptococcus chenjunshii]|uniref:Nucleoside diphosphate kinase n=1 Tax=Streptococcus chenjunshii TaxID=2173853 RepID=A0A372KPT4_9STRE|nr:nucleoside-diphosphate kinase [Streptococcus chenjunshii]AXQ78462.1 nucleoside-diphosphate kinase [Streptococcus chenjunshii]RFU52077.1 nucleoside-diphosphate kinase [Streptococcus chenjunshii]RFU54269.1 nucleoside-diphosphate kinase [Streptococcus chenjunshii]
MEKTFFMIKPDAVRRGLVGEVLSRIEKRGFTIERLELCQAKEAVLREHYAALTAEPFFSDLMAYMTSGPLLIGVLAGNDVIASWRLMMGATKPQEALPGTIRGDFAQAPSAGQSIENIVHGSDSDGSAAREISLWFS